MKNKGFIISAVITSLFCLGSINTAYAQEKYKVNRLGGQDRIETSVKIADNYNDGQLQAVVVTTANDFPEALTGSTLAAKCKAPILLADTTVQGSQKTLDYIKGHLTSNGTVYILGQTKSVSTDVENAIRNMGYTNIKRLEGSNKDETLKVINNEVNAAAGTPVFIASGDMFADALSASGIAAIKGYPIILCSNGVLQQTAVDQLQSIKPSQVYIAGGSAVVPDSIVQKVMSTTGLSSDKIVRLYGKDRYETSLAIDKKFNLTTENAIAASGENFPDALAGSSLAAKYSAPIMLTEGNSNSFLINSSNILNNKAEQKKYLDTINCSNLIILGGEGSISKNVEYVLSKDWLFWVKGAYTENNKNYITGCFDRFVYNGDSDVLRAAKAYKEQTGVELLSDYNYRTGDIGFEGFDMDISTPVTLEVADNVDVGIMEYSTASENHKDFNSIIKKNYTRPIFSIIFQDGIVKEMNEVYRP